MSSNLLLGPRRRATDPSAGQIFQAVMAAEVNEPAIHLWFGCEADKWFRDGHKSAQRSTATFRPPYSEHKMEWVTFSFDNTLEIFVKENRELILRPGLDGKPFAPHAGNGVYMDGLAVNCGGDGFLKALISVVQDCRMAQFPWLKDALPPSTYKQLSSLQIPRVVRTRSAERGCAFVDG